MTRVLLTGATGFVGRTLCGALARSGYIVRAAVRNDGALPAGAADSTIVGDIGSDTDWQAALRGMDLVIHLAARAHMLHDSPAHSNLYFETNVRGTERLAAASAQAGIRRFVLLSSIKVNGEETTQHAYAADDEPRPQDAYGSSKWHAEECVREVAERTGMEAVVVRPPLVYGPGVRANFLRLLRLIDMRWPLPLNAVDNSRSLVSIWNLCDLLVRVLEHPKASGGTWMVSDGEDLSTPELIRRIARAMDRRVWLAPVPVGVLAMLGALTGRRAEIARLCGSLAVNIDRTRRELDWRPPVNVDEAIVRTVTWYLSEARRP
jgi:nucleoside-diphosphate-sugar epimerase